MWIPFYFDASQHHLADTMETGATSDYGPLQQQGLNQYVGFTTNAIKDTNFNKLMILPRS